MTIIVQTTASASSRDYDWLKSAIAKWSGNRTDLDALIPDFVMLAEKRINGDLEARQQEAVANITALAGSASVPLPDDACELRSFALVGGAELTYLVPAEFNSLPEISGEPSHYTVVGTAVFLSPTPQADCVLQITYRQHVPALADSAGKNWLIEQFPDVYLAASMCEVIGYTKHMEALPMWEQKYATAIAGINRDNAMLGANLRIRPTMNIV